MATLKLIEENLGEVEAEFPIPNLQPVDSSTMEIDGYEELMEEKKIQPTRVIQTRNTRKLTEKKKEEVPTITVKKQEEVFEGEEDDDELEEAEEEEVFTAPKITSLRKNAKKQEAKAQTLEESLGALDDVLLEVKSINRENEERSTDAVSELVDTIGYLQDHPFTQEIKLTKDELEEIKSTAGYFKPLHNPFIGEIPEVDPNTQFVSVNLDGDTYRPNTDYAPNVVPLEKETDLIPYWIEVLYDAKSLPNNTFNNNYSIKMESNILFEEIVSKIRLEDTTQVSEYLVEDNQDTFGILKHYFNSHPQKYFSTYPNLRIIEEDQSVLNVYTISVPIFKMGKSYKVLLLGHAKNHSLTVEEIILINVNNLL